MNNGYRLESVQRSVMRPVNAHIAEQLIRIEYNFSFNGALAGPAALLGADHAVRLAICPSFKPCAQSFAVR
jgi:hypothetical protein